VASILEGSGAKRIAEVYQAHFGRPDQPLTQAAVQHAMQLLVAEAIRAATREERARGDHLRGEAQALLQQVWTAGLAKGCDAEFVDGLGEDFRGRVNRWLAAVNRE